MNSESNQLSPQTDAPKAYEPIHGLDIKPHEPGMSFQMSNGQTAFMRRSKAVAYYRHAQSIADNFSKDPSTKVGAVFIYPKTLHILSVGYNGMPRGVNEKLAERWERPLKYKLTEHAERNAIYNAAMSGTSLTDSICIASMFPCADCARGIIQSGCRMVISLKLEESGNADRLERWRPDWELSMMMLREAGVELMFLSKHEIIVDNKNKSSESRELNP